MKVAGDVGKGLVIGMIILWVTLGLCGMAICIIVIKCIIMANKPQPVPVQQTYVVKTVEMQQNPMGTVAVQQANPRKLDVAKSSVSQI